MMCTVFGIVLVLYGVRGWVDDWVKQTFLSVLTKRNGKG